MRFLMDSQNNTHLHSLEDASALESPFRRLLQNPGRILKKYIRQGMTVLDLGCGPGFFTLEIAKLVARKEMFENILDRIINNGFIVCQRPKIFFSRSVAMEIGK